MRNVILSFRFRHGHALVQALGEFRTFRRIFALLRAIAAHPLRLGPRLPRRALQRVPQLAPPAVDHVEPRLVHQRVPVAHVAALALGHVVVVQPVVARLDRLAGDGVGRVVEELVVGRQDALLEGQAAAGSACSSSSGH